MKTKLIADVMNKMITFSFGNLHDVAHFMKVYTFARTIGIKENISTEKQEILEITAIIHDISCPLCRIKYGNTNGKYQELESPALVREFLKDVDISDEYKERINFIVSHHHTYTNVDGIDYQILLEADFLVNADESNMTKEQIENAYNTFFKTNTGKEILKNMYFVS